VVTRTGPSPTPRRAWPQILGIGLALWIATVVVTLLTGNTNLIPTVVLLGSFLVPVTFVTWAYERQRSERVGVELMFRAFVVGGVLGILGAAVLESYLLRPDLFLFLGVGLIEEAVKLAAVWIIARNLGVYTVRDGLLLGATVGFGFAAFESAGYALSALITGQGLDLMALVVTEILRGLLSPLGHGLWTAVLAGVLFAAARGGRLRLSATVVLAYLGVSLLHALWDGMHPLAVGLVMVLTGTHEQFALLARGDLHLTAGQSTMIAVVNWVGLLAISLVALGWLLALRSRHRTA
jgi:protease PrsW